MLWVLSRKVKIYNTEWVPDVDRVVYYRPTANQTLKSLRVDIAAAEATQILSQNERLFFRLN